MSVLSQNIQTALSLARTNRFRGAATDPRNQVLLSPDGANNLHVICSDSTTETQIRISGSIGDAVAIAPQFCDLVQTLNSGVNITLTPTDKATCKVQTGKSRFTLPATNAKDFPRFAEEAQEKTTEFSVNAQVLKRALASVNCGLGKPDPAKLFTTGILFKATPQGLFLVASNGFKLVTVSLAAKLAEGAAAIDGVVPEMGVAQIQRLADSAGDDDTRISFVLGARQIKASVGEAIVRSRLVACQFPDYARVTKVDNPASFQASKSAVLAVLKRVGLFVQNKNPFVSLTVDDGKLVCTVKTDQGECVESTEVEGAAATAQAQLNISYLAAILEAMPQDKVTLDFGANVLRVQGTGQTHNAVAIAAHYKT